MTISAKHLYIAVAIVVAALAGHAYLTSAKNLASAETVKKMVSDETARLRTDLAKQLATVQQDKRDVQTPQQIVVKIPEYVPSLPAAPYITTSSSAPTAPVTKQASSKDSDLPDSPGALMFPHDDIKPLFDHLADCQGLSYQLAEQQGENRLLQQRVASDEKAIKGGSFWRRLRSNARWFAIGGAAGAGAVLATHEARK